jgi:hypothetical protein
MDERIVPVIVLTLNLVLYVYVLTIVQLNWLSAIWGIISSVSLILVAYEAYENSKKLDFIEEHVWKRISELDERIKHFESMEKPLPTLQKDGNKSWLVNDKRVQGLLDNDDI